MPKVWVVRDLQGCYAALKEAEFVLGEKIASVDFVHFNSALNPADWERGRAFGKSAEVRWRKCRDTVRATLFYEIDELPARLIGYVSPDPQDQLPLSDCRREAAEYYLWGAYSARENRWHESRIPSVPAYPVHAPVDGMRVAIVAEEYSRAGSLEFVRFREVK